MTPPDLELRRAGRWWEYRFPWPGYRFYPNLIIWSDWENGKALTERGARKKALRHWRRLVRKTPSEWTHQEVTL